MVNTYHVSPAGNDSNDGSHGSPWLTIAKVVATPLSPGDTVLFERGGVWREQLKHPGAGDNGLPITFGAYGTGDAPQIKGSNIKPNTSFALHDSNTYSAAHVPQQATLVYVWEDGVRLTAQSSIAAVVANPGSSHYAAGVLYIHAGDSSEVRTNGKLYEASQRTFCIHCDADWQVVQDLQLEHTGFQFAVIGLSSNNCIVRRCNIYRGAYHNILITGADNVVEDCYSISRMVTFYNVTSQRNIVRRCVLLGDKDTSNLAYAHGSVDGNPSDNVFEECLIDRAVNAGGLGTPLTLFDGTGFIVRRNLIRGYGYRITFRDSEVLLHHNIIDGRLFENVLLKIENAQVTFLHNTIQHFHVSVAVSMWAIDVDATSNVTSRNNIVIAKHWYVWVASGATWVASNNCYHASTRATPFRWQTIFMTLANYQAASGQDTGSFTVDPLLIEPTLRPSELSPVGGRGENLGTGYRATVSPQSQWPSNVLTASQSDGNWDVGAYRVVPDGLAVLTEITWPALDEVDGGVQFGPITGTEYEGTGVNQATIEAILDARGVTVANKAQTGDAYARLGNPTGESVSADVAAIKADTGNSQTLETETIMKVIIDALTGIELHPERIILGPCKRDPHSLYKK